jgi:hypothetical protein
LKLGKKGARDKGKEEKNQTQNPINLTQILAFHALRKKRAHKNLHFFRDLEIFS